MWGLCESDDGSGNLFTFFPWINLTSCCATIAWRCTVTDDIKRTWQCVAHLWVELGVEKRSMAAPEVMGDESVVEGFLWSSFRRCSCRERCKPFGVNAGQQHTTTEISSKKVGYLYHTYEKGMFRHPLPIITNPVLLKWCVSLRYFTIKLKSISSMCFWLHRMEGLF